MIRGSGVSLSSSSEECLVVVAVIGRMRDLITGVADRRARMMLSLAIADISDKRHCELRREFEVDGECCKHFEANGDSDGTCLGLG